MQTKLGAKFNILIDRVMNLFFNREEKKREQPQGTQNVVRVSQPMAGQHQPSQADYLDRTQLLPSNPALSSMPTKFPPQQLQQQQPTQTPDYFPMSNEPMAANDGGGGGWGSW
jgi:hypothetical protein